MPLLISPRPPLPNHLVKGGLHATKNHKKTRFFDGNKRTAYLSMFLFLKLNGFQLSLPKEIAKDLVMEANLAKDTEKEMLKLAAFIEKNSHPLT